MTDRKAKELGYIDVSFVNLTEERERQERRQNIIGGLFTVLCALAGFVFWPMMVWWTSGVDLTVEMVDASAGFNMMVVGIMLATSVLFGFVGLAIAKRD